MLLLSMLKDGIGCARLGKFYHHRDILYFCIFGTQIEVFHASL